jgi:uncharacterized protein (TIGR02246 family)
MAIDYERQLTPPSIIDEPGGLERAVQALVDQSAIKNLVALYSITRDDHDIDKLISCFAEDGTFTSRGVTIRGRDDLRAFYIANMGKYTTTLHTSHMHLVQFIDDDEASGLVTAHAELGLGDTLMVAGLRYSDRYVRRVDRWVFQHRTLKFIYAVPFDDMGSSFRDSRRIRWPGTDPIASGFPESLPTWTSWRPGSDT